MKNRLMFYCQHLVGIGHLVRSAEIVRSLVPNWDVLFVCGGPIPESFVFPESADVLRLPVICSDAEYSSLQTRDSALSIDMVQATRSTQLVQSLNEFEPDVVVTELFPFGRRQFSFELIPLLMAAQNAQKRPLIAASVRDILVTKKNQQRHEEWVCSVVNRYYDLVLVHSDRAIQALNDTFSRVRDLSCPVEYTGYVVPSWIESPTEITEGAAPLVGKPYILVSVGSGQLQAGEFLIESVLRAARLLSHTIPHRIIVCAGPSVSQEKYEQYSLQARHLLNVTLLHHSNQMRQLLAHTALSISLAGYNTTMEVLTSGVPALMYPAEPNGDQEQMTRAKNLAVKGILRLLGRDELAQERFAEIISTSLTKAPTSLHIDTTGAPTSANLLHRYLWGHAIKQSHERRSVSLGTAIPYSSNHKRDEAEESEARCD